MQYHENVLTTIGNTPLIRLNKVTSEVDATVLAKVETFNPGHSIKDRMALKMLEDAEAEGKLKPGGTIIECTSGNTGMGLAIAAAVKGYRSIFTTSDKQSKEKLDILRAMGSEVIVCPTNVEPEDERSYYSVARRLSEEIPNSFWFNQYDNLSNRQAHYESTGPEIWAQTEGKVTHLVVGVGTGGTISGTAKFLKEQNPEIQILGVDTYGSVFKKYKETGVFDEKEIYPYVTEGIGEDILPKNVDFDLIDYFEKVTDKDGAVMTRRLAKEEGLLQGYSCGSAVAGLVQMKERFKPGDVVVVIFHDHGSRYVGKLFNDDWMRERGWLDAEVRVQDVLQHKSDKEFITVTPRTLVRDAFTVMKDRELSQLPVFEGEEMVGSVTESQVLTFILNNPLDNANKEVSEVMGKPFPIVEATDPLSKLSRYISREVPAVIARERSGGLQILTNYDIVRAL